MEELKYNLGKIQPKEIVQEMQSSYLDYAMSVIIARALPDVRDGLKPVHRRILYAMGGMGLTHAAKYRKCAYVVGEVLGKYHPHGDMAVYDTLVRMAQDFSMRYPLINGQGNFGSIDGDAPAAMRYTEAKMTALAEEMLFDIDKNTVEFVDNYDATRVEPKVLPSKVPNLLLNGSMGIAVGMATNIPPHNLGELVDGICAQIDNPPITIEELMQSIQGPDFPTFGHIYSREDVKGAYATGKGKITIRGVAEIEEKTNGWRILISQIPYQVNKSDLVSKIADLVKNKKIEGIADLRDESDRKSGVRIVIDLKSSAYPKKILNRLYELTPLQSDFHINMLALIDGIVPRTLNLKEILGYFIEHRKQVVLKRSTFDKDRAEKHLHILEGLKKAIDHINQVIELIKKSKTREDAAKALQKKYALTKDQSDAILDMRLSALASLERQKVSSDIEETKKFIEKMGEILSDPKRVNEVIKKELLELKAKFGNERRTQIYAQRIGEFRAEDLIPNEDVVVIFTKDNYIKRMPITFHRAQARGGKGVLGITRKEEDVVSHLVTCQTLDDIMFFTNRGRVFTTKVYDLPASSRQAKGQAIVNIIQIGQEEKVTAILAVPPQSSADYKYFLMATKGGIVKKTVISAYQHIRRGGLIAIKLRSDDTLEWARTTSGNDNVVLVTKKGQGIYFSENALRSLGRSATGVRGIRLKEGDGVISMTTVQSTVINPNLLVVTTHGFGKRTSLSYFRVQGRAGVGVKAAKITPRTGGIAKAIVVWGDEGDIVLITRRGQMIRLPMRSVKKLGRDTQGVILIRLPADDKVASVTFINREKEEIIDIAPAETVEIKRETVIEKKVEHPKEEIASQEKVTSFQKEIVKKEVVKSFGSAKDFFDEVEQSKKIVEKAKPKVLVKKVSKNISQPKLTKLKENVKIHHYQKGTKPKEKPNKNKKTIFREPNWWGRK